MKYFKFLTSQYVFASLIGQMTAALLGLLSFVLLSHTYSKENFGEWILFITAATFMDMLRMGLTRNPIIYFTSSSNNKEKHQKTIASGLAIGLTTDLVVLLIILSGQWLFPAIMETTYAPVFKYYPFLALANLFWNNSYSSLAARSDYQSILLIRLVIYGSFDAFLLVNFFLLTAPIHIVFHAFIFANLLGSLFSIGRGWSGLLILRKATWEDVCKMIRYGTYTLGSTVSSNLLKSTDTLLIASYSIWGSAAVALYAIPLKLTEIAEFPLRSICMAAFPKLTRDFSEKKIEEFKTLFASFSGSLLLLMIPFALFGWVFADEMIVLLGGAEYQTKAHELGNIFRVFCIYSLLLPIDRMTGIALDSLSLPQKNFKKVLLMLTTNIIGDLIAIYVFQSLLLISVFTVLFTVVGIGVGRYYMSQTLHVPWKQIFRHGLRQYQEILSRKKRKGTVLI